MGQKWFLFAGNPVPEITWHKDGQLLQEDKSHHIMSGGRFLQITNAQVLHTGRYTCLASNVAGDKSKSFSLNVFGRYKFFIKSWRTRCDYKLIFFFLCAFTTSVIEFHYVGSTSVMAIYSFYLIN